DRETDPAGNRRDRAGAGSGSPQRQGRHGHSRGGSAALTGPLPTCCWQWDERGGAVVAAALLSCPRGGRCRCSSTTACRWRLTSWGGSASPSMVALPCGLASRAVTLLLGIALLIYAAKAAKHFGKGHT